MLNELDKERLGADYGAHWRINGLRRPEFYEGPEHAILPLAIHKDEIALSRIAAHKRGRYDCMLNVKLSVAMVIKARHGRRGLREDGFWLDRGSHSEDYAA